MEAEEDSQRDFEESTLRAREDKDILLQISMRDEWSDTMAESVGQVRRDHNCLPRVICIVLAYKGR